MFLKPPQNKEKIHWTSHSKMKLRYYRFSENRVLRILRKPDRVEEGIAPHTIAAMQKTGTRKRPTEAWVMYSVSVKTSADKQKINQKSKIKNQKLRVISAWRYPGITPVGQRPIIPDDILRELNL